MAIFSTILGSSVFMVFVAAVCAIFCIRCLVYGVMGGTSTLLRILATLVFAALAYYCWHHAMSLNGPNMIDSFVYDTWAECKQLFQLIKSKF